MKPAHILQRLYPALNQCEAIETEVLKTEKFQLVRQLHGLKKQYNSEFQALIGKLSTVAYDVLLRGFGGTLNAHQERRLNTYFMELQVEVSMKISRLQEIDAALETDTQSSRLGLSLSIYPYLGQQPVLNKLQYSSHPATSTARIQHSSSKEVTRTVWRISWTRSMTSCPPGRLSAPDVKSSSGNIMYPTSWGPKATRLMVSWQGLAVMWPPAN